MRNDWKPYTIHKEIQNALYAMGYDRPTSVQKEAMPPISEGKDVVIQGETGSGKTAAFAIPFIDQIAEEENRIQALVIVPTRELAVQVANEFSEIGRYKRLRALPVFGKQSLQRQKDQLKQRVHVVVATPGRLKDLLEKEAIKLESISWLVIDEADEMLQRGFLEDVEWIIDHVKKRRQTVFLSATIDEQLTPVIEKTMNQPVYVHAKQEVVLVSEVMQYHCVYRNKNESEETVNAIIEQLLIDLEPRTGIIFANTQQRVDALVYALKKEPRLRKRIIALHGGLPQKERLRRIEGIKNGEPWIVVATDLIARGIHIDGLSLVIHAELPVNPENYVHRNGRTGRAGMKGTVIALIEMAEQSRVASLITDKEPLGASFQWEDVAKRKGSMDSIKKELVVSNANQQVQRRQKEERKNYDIERIRLNIGKKKKLRAGDVVASVCSIHGIESDDIGIIDIRDTCTYVELFHNKGHVMLEQEGHLSVKGRIVKMKQLKNR